jgi:UDP-N-acetylmuramate--alanine ligase
MKLTDIKTAYFIGIGGIGMSAIARYFNSIGIQVSGYDKTRNDFTIQLEKEGFEIHYIEDIKAIPEEILQNKGIVIYTPAIPIEHKEKVHLISLGIKLYKRAEILGLISENQYTIAIAGTHGKTTTSCLIAHILNDNNINFTAFLGGISTNLNSNYIHKTDGIKLLKEDIIVVEADEYDRSFLHLKPNIAIVTSTDADHLDIYGQHADVIETFHEFLKNTKADGKKIICEKADIKEDKENIKYGKNENCDAIISDINIKEGQFHFQYSYKETTVEVCNGIPGFHNVENTTAAITACLQMGLSIQSIVSSCAKFLGVKRRFEYIVKQENHIVIDDYAHHPTELSSFILSVKELYPYQKTVGIFQPHLYSRTRDFADEFAESLDLLDECWLMDIYPARELPIPGVNSEFLALKMKKPVVLISHDNILKQLKEKQVPLLLIMGAGNIDQLIKPIIEIYQNA